MKHSKAEMMAWFRDRPRRILTTKALQIAFQLSFPGATEADFARARAAAWPVQRVRDETVVVWPVGEEGQINVPSGG